MSLNNNKSDKHQFLVNNPELAALFKAAARDDLSAIQTLVQKHDNG